nr:MAG: RNA-dependent RNA polymerase [Porcine picobirnavirus]
MPKSNEVELGKYFNLPNPGLKSYFDIVRSGQPDEYRTTFARGKSPSEVLREWKPKLDSLSDTWPSLVEFENDLAKKVGPMSVMKPLSERMSDIDHYYEDILLSSAPIDHSAVAAVIKEWSGLRGLTPRTQKRTVEMMKKSTNSGSPYFSKRRFVVGKSFPCSVYMAGRNVRQLLPHSEWLACAVLGWRGQEGGPQPDDVKQRVVWMFPFSVNIRELQVYQPLIETAQRFNLVPSWVSMEAVDDRITKLFDTKAPNDLIICTDFSRFDQHFNPEMQEAGKTILTALMNGSNDSKEWLESVYPVKYMIPLMYDLGKVRHGQHGMGSGSGGTNADETLVHRALQYECAMSRNQRLNPNSQCLGDDGIISFPGITVEDVMRSYTRHGQEMNTDKQYASTQDCIYLRRWHHTNYRKNGVAVGVYSTYRALGRLMEQERYYDPSIWGPKMVALRQLSIIENVKYHPLCNDFAEFCIERDRYRLGIDIPGFLANIDSEAKAAMEQMPDFLGYTKSQMKSAEMPGNGISDWWIVKYLKSR